MLRRNDVAVEVDHPRALQSIRLPKILGDANQRVSAPAPSQEKRAVKPVPALTVAAPQPPNRHIRFAPDPYRPPQSSPIPIPGAKMPSNRTTRCFGSPDKLLGLQRTEARVHHRSDDITDYCPLGHNYWGKFHNARLQDSEKQIGTAAWTRLPPGLPIEREVLANCAAVRASHNGLLPVERKDIKKRHRIVHDEIAPHQDVRMRNCRLWKMCEKKSSWEATHTYKAFRLGPLIPEDKCSWDEVSLSSSNEEERKNDRDWRNKDNREERIDSHERSVGRERKDGREQKERANGLLKRLSICRDQIGNTSTI